jgi:predicted  nucleic acid-binding Zn-ribbon protein
MSVVGQLYELQEIDLEIAEEERKLEQVSSRLGKDDVVVAASAKVDAEKEKLKELQHRQHTLEWEIDDLSSKIKDTDAQLYGGSIKNPKELSGLQHEIELWKAKREGLETQDLDIMEKIEALEKGIVALNRELEDIKEGWQREQEELEKEKAALENSLNDLKRRRQALASEVEARILTLYEGLRKNKGLAVARVEQGICRGCRISLPSSELQQVRSNALVQCSSCNRILYLP